MANSAHITIKSSDNIFSMARSYFHLMGVTFYHFATLIAFSLLQSCLNAGGLILLLPLAKGILSNDFTFITRLPFFKSFVDRFPGIISFGTQESRHLFILIIAVLFILQLARVATVYFISVYNAYWRGKFSLNLTTALFDRYLCFGKLYFDKNSSGHIRQVLRFSRRAMRLLIVCQGMVTAVLELIFRIIIMSIISFRLTLITLIVFPILHYAVKKHIARIQTIAAMITKGTLKLNKNIFSILLCIPLIKLYSKEDRMKKTFFLLNDRIRKLRFKKAMVNNLLQPIQQLVIYSSFILILLFTVLRLMDAPKSQIANFLVFIYLAQGTLPMFNIFNGFKASIANLTPPLTRVLEVFENKNKDFIPEGTLDFKGLEKNISFNHLDFSYIEKGKRVTLKDISFSIEKNGITALVGPSGSGKTTLVSLIMRFYSCPPGTLKVDDINIEEFSLKSLKAKMALVSQRIWLFNDTIRHNLIFGLDRKVNNKELMDVMRKVGLLDFVMELPIGFDTEIGDLGSRMSGGERQRLSIARTLLKRPEIIILDEATSFLDAKTEKLIHDAIDEVTKDRTCIVIANKLSTINRADKIIFIKDGELIEQGPLTELLNNQGEFYTYWQEQHT